MTWRSHPSANSSTLTGRQRAQFRAEVFAKHGRACFHCGNPATTADHIIPIARGGRHHVSNGQPLCASCHDAKTRKEIVAARRSKPRGAYRMPRETHPGLKG